MPRVKSRFCGVSQLKNTVVKSREAYTVDRSSTASPPRAAMMTTMSAVPHSDTQVTP